MCRGWKKKPLVAEMEDVVIIHQTVLFTLTKNVFMAQASNSLKGKGNAYFIQEERAMHTLYNQRLLVMYNELTPLWSPCLTEY